MSGVALLVMAPPCRSVLPATLMSKPPEPAEMPLCAFALWKSWSICSLAVLNEPVTTLPTHRGGMHRLTLKPELF
ncbi:hypothetical protein D9M68_870140 [compost metagenome]